MVQIWYRFLGYCVFYRGFSLYTQAENPCVDSSTLSLGTRIFSILRRRYRLDRRAISQQSGSSGGLGPWKRELATAPTVRIAMLAKRVPYVASKIAVRNGSR